MKKVFILLLSSVILATVSCQKEVPNPTNEGVNKMPDLPLSLKDRNEKNLEAKLEFASALVKTMHENKMLRSLIKEQALKMFNNDYEILFELIKDENIGGLTVREAIIKNLENHQVLTELERDFPTMTILVPELPMDKFSAKLWQLDSVPAVAVQRTTSNDVPVVLNTGVIKVITQDRIPAFPVIVIKENERLVNEGNSEFKKLKTRTIVSKGGKSFKFLDDVFDGEKNPYKTPVQENTRKGNLTTQGTIFPSIADPKIVQAYNTYNVNDGWHRDLIYYDIDPSAPNGPFNYDYQEHVTSFALEGDPHSVYSKISDQTGDPTWWPFKPRNHSGWTDGFFEFKIKALVNSKNGIGEQITKYLNLTPINLFYITYIDAGSTMIMDQVQLKTVPLLTIPIFNWNIDEYASTIKIEIEEVDATEIITTTDSRTVKYATNFGIDATTEQKVKQGLKFGASLENTTTSTVQKSVTLANDVLGDVIVNFADNIITGPVVIDGATLWQTREYSSGWFNITVEPKRVQ